MNNEKEIITKLLTIAKNQQKIITKLAQQTSDSNRIMESKLKATFQKLMPHAKLTNVRVDGMIGAHPEAHIEGEGVEPSQVKGIATEVFLLENRVPTIYFNGNIVSAPNK